MRCKPRVLLLCFIALSTLAHADSIQITLTQSSLSGTAGSTLTFDASLANLSSTDTVFLNGDSSTTTSLLLSVDDSPFLTNAPLSLDPNGSSGPFALFSVVIDPTTPVGTYDFNSFSILGGTDGNASDLLGTADFSVIVNSPVSNPEPGSIVLLFSGLLGAGMGRRLWSKHGGQPPSPSA